MPFVTSSRADSQSLCVSVHAFQKVEQAKEVKDGLLIFGEFSDRLETRVIARKHCL